VIIGSTDMALDEGGLDASTHQLLGVIRDTGQRAAVLTRQLLTFGQRDSLQISTIQLPGLMDRISALLGHVLSPAVELDVNVGSEIWPILGDQAKIEQVILNLCVNARDAMADGGWLRLSLENTEVGPADIAIVPGIQPGPFVLLTVADSGCGMDQEVLQHIFEPFYTTKAPGLGTGLGLATVYGVVGQLNGFTAVASEPGQGSTFRVYFPGHPDEVAEDTQLGTDQSGAAPSPPPGCETVLVVDDDEAIRSLIKLILERQGYTVVPVANGEEALGAIARSNRSFDLLVTDLALPGMDGRALVEVARASVPGLRVLFVSGIAGSAPPGSAGEGDAPLLQKPFNIRALASKVREVLDQ
jgi:CheY-like chemotaxis protein